MQNRNGSSPSCDEMRIQITPPLDEHRALSPKLSFTMPMSANILPSDFEHERDLPAAQSSSSIELKEDKKKSRKSAEDPPKSKRKDTAASITNFIHRLTRFDREDKHKSTVIEEEPLNRPDKLLLPLPGDGEETWFEMKTMGTDNFRTALDMANESGLQIYEWKADTLEETLLTEFSNVHRDLIRMEEPDVDLDIMESSLNEMLDDFRSGNMRAFTDAQLEALRLAKQEHEGVTDLHLSLYSIEDPSTFDDRVAAVCDELAKKMRNMHSQLSELVLPPKD